MIDLDVKIDRLAAINDKITELKNEKSMLEAEVIKQCESDLENTKLKSKNYMTEKTELTATNSESLKITYPAFLPFIFGNAYKDAVTESTTYKLSAPATRMIIGIWQGNYIKNSVYEVITTMIVDDETKKQLIKKCKGKNYKKDVENIRKFTEMSYEDASEWAYLIAEADIWQSFINFLELNGVDVSDEYAVNDIISKIRAAFIVDETTKIAITKLGDEDA